MIQVQERVEKLTVRIVIPTIPDVNTNDLFEAITQALNILKVGHVTYRIPESAIKISANGKSSRLTKGKKIWSIIEESVKSGDFLDRSEIAAQTDSTVSRVAEILKEHDSDPIAQNYKRMAEEAKYLKRIAKVEERDANRSSLIEILNEEYERELDNDDE